MLKLSNVVIKRLRYPKVYIILNLSPSTTHSQQDMSGGFLFDLEQGLFIYIYIYKIPGS